MGTGPSDKEKQFRAFRKCQLCGAIFSSQSTESVGAYCSKDCHFNSRKYCITKTKIPKRTFYGLQYDAWVNQETIEEVAKKIVINHYKKTVYEEKIDALDKSMKEVQEALKVLNARTLQAPMIPKQRETNPKEHDEDKDDFDEAEKADTEEVLTRALDQGRKE